MHQDTITAIATAIGKSGIGIIRLSGSQAHEIGFKIFRNSKMQRVGAFANQKLYYGYAVDASENIVDEVMAAAMRSPKTYTREDMFELHCHGNMIILNQIIEMTLRCGARLAEPGEFTKRAFLNGRIDLTQAEAVMDMIAAKSTRAVKLSINQLKGRLSQKIESIQKDLLHLLAMIEVDIDSLEDESMPDNSEAYVTEIEHIIREIDLLLATEQTGNLMKEGIKAAFIGKPNVGKSSLLNAIAGSDRAIVTEIPGTTRDTVEYSLLVDGFEVHFIDTAGLRQSEDLVEQIGVERTKEAAKQADILFIVFDAAKPLEAEDLALYEQYRHSNHAILLNKCDIQSDASLPPSFDNEIVLRVSAVTGEGVVNISKYIKESLRSGEIDADAEVIIASQRILEALRKADKALCEAKETIRSLIPVDIAAIDIREAADKLGEITGAHISEALVSAIFSDFCVGK